MPTEFFHTQYEGNGISHMNINLIGLSESSLNAGDELAAFDGDLCVGALKITSDQLMAGTASLISSYSTSVVNKDGFTNGDAIKIYLWNKSASIKTEVGTIPLEGTMVFAQNGSVLIEMNNLTTGTNLLTNDVQFNVFPNPCNDKFTVRFNELPDLGSRIEILDIAGRMVSSRQIENQSEMFDITNQPPGLYLVKTTIGSKSKTQKLIVNN
jgi:hypothetical protein